MYQRLAVRKCIEAIILLCPCTYSPSINAILAQHVPFLITRIMYEGIV